MKRLFLFTGLILIFISCILASSWDGTANPNYTKLPSPTGQPGEIGRVSIPSARINYYEITGATENELLQQLDVLGPIDDQGQRNDASTKWFVSWNWPGYGTGTCSLKDATTRLDVQVIFPHWVHQSQAPSELINKWIKYTQVLALHEKGHVDNILANYKTVLIAIKAANCATAESAAQAALIPIRRNDINYDTATRHGATQGATFP